MDPEGWLVRREDEVIVFAFSVHDGKAVDDVARTDPGFLDGMLRKDLSEEAKAIARKALARVRSTAISARV